MTINEIGLTRDQTANKTDGAIDLKELGELGISLTQLLTAIGKNFSPIAPTIKNECGIALIREGEKISIIGIKTAPNAQPAEEWHDDDGHVMWWTSPISEPPWVGTPNCSDWPGYHTHFTPLPDEPENLNP